MKLLLENWQKFLNESAPEGFEEDEGYYSMGKSTSEYHPAWDYEPNENPSLLSMEVYEMAFSKVQSLATKLGFGSIALYFIAGDRVDNHVARYINGTYKSPVIVLSDKVEQEDEALLTLFHELGHAYIDSAGIEMEEEEEEEAVEEFAHAVYMGDKDALSHLESEA